MKKTGKIISVTLIMAIIAYIFSMPASAVLLGKDGFYYEFDNNDAVLKEYHSSSQEVEIPSEVYSHDVVKIADYTFLRNTEITSVIVSETVTKIGNSAFYGCSNLESIFIPESVTSLGNSIFANCEKLTIICYPDSAAETYAKNNNIHYELIEARDFEDTDTEPDDPDNKTPIMGDVDGDGKVTTVDSLLVLRASVGLQIFDDNQKTAADVDYDGLLTSNDSLMILRYCVGFLDEGVNIGTEF